MNFRHKYRFSSCVKSHPDFLGGEQMSASFHQEQAIVFFEKCTQSDSSFFFKRACNIGIANALANISDYSGQAAYARLLKHHSRVPTILARRVLSRVSKHAPWEGAGRANPTAVKFKNVDMPVTLPIYSLGAGISRNEPGAHRKDSSGSSLKKVGTFHEIAHMRYLIPVRIEDKRVWMALDTGSPDSLLRKSFVTQLRLPTRYTAVRTLFASIVNLQTHDLSYTTLRISVGKDTFEHQNMLIFPANGTANAVMRIKDADGRPIVGILGLDFLRKFGAIRINFSAHEVYFGAETTTGHCTALTLSSMEPLGTDYASGGNWIGSVTAMRATIAKRNVTWSIDSGWTINNIANAGATLVSKVHKWATSAHKDRAGFNVFYNIPTDATMSGKINLQVAPNSMRLPVGFVISGPTAFARHDVGFNFSRGTVCYK